MHPDLVVQQAHTEKLSPVIVQNIVGPLQVLLASIFIPWNPSHIPRSSKTMTQSQLYAQTITVFGYNFPLCLQESIRTMFKQTFRSKDFFMADLNLRVGSAIY